jgi:hypothetical protein
MDYMASVMWQGKESVLLPIHCLYSEIAIYRSLQVVMDWPITDNGIGSTSSRTSTK